MLVRVQSRAPFFNSMEDDMELKVITNTKKKRGRKPNSETAKYREVRNWDPISQAKFIFEINKEAGTPVTKAEAYETANHFYQMSKRNQSVGN